MKASITLTKQEAINILKQIHCTFSDCNSDEVEVKIEDPVNPSLNFTEGAGVSLTTMLKTVTDIPESGDASRKLRRIRYLREAFAAKGLHLNLGDAKMAVEFLFGS